MYMLPKKTWSNEARERQRKQEQDDEQKSHRTPEEAIMGTSTTTTTTLWTSSRGDLSEHLTDARIRRPCRHMWRVRRMQR
jgi:hypothetical protein